MDPKLFFIIMINCAAPYTSLPLAGQSSKSRGRATFARTSGVERGHHYDPDTSLANDHCLVKYKHLEGGLKAQQVFPVLPAEETARTKPSEVKCNYIKMLYIIMASQREMG